MKTKSKMMKMKFFISIFLISAIFTYSKLFAQDEKIDSLTFESTPIHEEKPPYFAVGGGYIGNFLYTNFDDLNKLIKIQGLSNLKTPVYMSGGQGFTGIGVIPNLRVGFFGYGGAKKIELDTSVLSSKVLRGFEYAVSMTGLSVDYGFIILKSLAVLPGISLGWGNVTLETYQTSGNYSWNQILPVSDSLNYLKRMQASLYFIQPNIYVEYALTQFFMLRFNAGYSMTFMGSWNYDRNSSLSGVPSTINGNGLILGFGVYVGLFNY